MTKKSRQKFEYLDNKKSFKDEIKSIFHQFSSAFSCQLSQTWDCTFNYIGYQKRAFVQFHKYFKGPLYYGT